MVQWLALCLLLTLVMCQNSNFTTILKLVTPKHVYGQSKSFPDTNAESRRRSCAKNIDIHFTANVFLSDNKSLCKKKQICWRIIEQDDDFAPLFWFCLLTFCLFKFNIIFKFLGCFFVILFTYIINYFVRVRYWQCLCNSIWQLVDKLRWMVRRVMNVEQIIVCYFDYLV